jgi:membrane-associated protein
VIGGVAWVLICTLAGYFLGNHPFVQENFSIVVLAIIALSLVPAVWEFWRARTLRRRHPEVMEELTPEKLDLSSE